MPIIKGLETTFNMVYSEYDKWRPTSDHIAIEERKRSKFFSEIQNAIEKFGNKITL